ncbi:MAG: SPOR domain-containing protein [Desulfitobacterium sp.]|nr:SPOR domain-containing protein [Desulfitobacterium sp.]
MGVKGLNRQAIIVVVLVLLVWMTTYFGYTYVKLVTQSPRTIKATSEKNPVEVALRLEKIEFWTCQVGVFKLPENAKGKKLLLQQSGWDARILGKEPYIIGVGFAHSQEELAILQKLLEEGGITTFSKKVLIPEGVFTLRGRGAEETAAILGRLNNYLNTSPSEKEKNLNNLEISIQTAPKGLDMQENLRHLIEQERDSSKIGNTMNTLGLVEEYINLLEILKTNR